MTLKCKARINLYKSISGTHVPCYLGFWVWYQNGSLEHHKHWFCPNDLSHCVSGIAQKFAIVRPTIPTIWHIQESTSLIQKEMIILENVGFSFISYIKTMLEVYLASNMLFQAILCACFELPQPYEVVQCKLSAYNSWQQKGEMAFHFQIDTTHQQLGG